ncbi:MAG TPA: hypothetical protein VK820_01245 [Steroidobacteraceae bacterium]|nr:hypothetical protein [Steroidobacteraceae bacterium]
MIRHRYLVWPIVLGVWLSGALWLVFDNFLMRRGEFGLAAHPLETWWLRAHGAFAFASLWLLGFLSVAHVGERWAWRRQRRSGLLLLAVYIWLAVSGYLLYYAGGDAFRAAVSLGHWTVGLLAIFLLLLHRRIRSDGAR